MDGRADGWTDGEMDEWLYVLHHHPNGPLQASQLVETRILLTLVAAPAAEGCTRYEKQCVGRLASAIREVSADCTLSEEGCAVEAEAQGVAEAAEEREAGAQAEAAAEEKGAVVEAGQAAEA
eukprot:scaffold428164_cov39-Prasinocladus_malaysianus.AAC.2